MSKRMKTAHLVGVLMLTACQKTDPTANLKSQYGMMERVGASKEALCVQARKIEQAYLESLNESAYRQQREEADLMCLTARIEARSKT